MKPAKTKKRNQLILLLVIFIVLLGAYFGVRQYNKAQEAEEPQEEIAVTSLNADNITEVSYTNDGVEYSFIKTEDTWQYTGDTSIPITQSYIETIVSSACSLKAKRLLVGNLDNIAEYGLEIPAHAVSLTDSDGNKTIINIGDMNTSTSVYYAYVEGKENIYTIDNTLPDTINYTLEQLITMEEIPDMNSSNITDMSFTDSDTSLDFEYFESGNSEYDYSGSLLWFLKDSGEYSAAGSTAVSTLQTNISSLAFQSMVKYNPVEDDLSTYGLDSPQAVLDVKYTNTDTQTAENTFILKIGKADESGNYYVQVDGMNGVYTMTGDIVKYFLDLTKLDFANKTAFNVQKDTIDSIVINAEGKTWNIVLNKETATDGSGNETVNYTYTLNGTQIEDTKFDAFYSKLQNLTAESVMEAGTSQADYMTITFNRNTDVLKTVAFTISSYNASFYQTAINSSNVLLLNEQSISSLMTMLNELS